MKNVTFHLKNEDILDFLEKYNGNKSEFAEKALYEAIVALRKEDFLRSVSERQKWSTKMKRGTVQDTVRFTRKLRLSS